MLPIGLCCSNAQVAGNKQIALWKSRDCIICTVIVVLNKNNDKIRHKRIRKFLKSLTRFRIKTSRNYKRSTNKKLSKNIVFQIGEKVPRFSKKSWFIEYLTLFSVSTVCWQRCLISSLSIFWNFTRYYNKTSNKSFLLRLFNMSINMFKSSYLSLRFE